MTIFTFIYKNEPLQFLIQRNRYDEAKQLLKVTYPKPVINFAKGDKQLEAKAID